MAVDLTFIQEIENLFEPRWAPYVVLCLFDGPKRFGVIAKTINAQCVDRLADAVLGTTLGRLQQTGLVRRMAPTREARYCPYSLTPAGQAFAIRLIRIKEALKDASDPG